MHPHSNYNKKLRLLFILCIFSISNLFSQKVVGYLELAGRAQKANKDLSGATIRLYKNGMLEKELISGRNGKFKFFVDFGYDYKLTFAAKECVDMHLIIAAKIPKDKYHIMPYYDLGDIPFFEPESKIVNVEKFKQPFLKIIFDGNKLFKDDENYTIDFNKEVYVDPAAEALAEAERKAHEKDVQYAAEKERRDAEELAKRKQESAALEQARLLAEQRALEEQRIREELEKLKEEKEHQAAMLEKNNSVAMAKEDMKLLEEREHKTIVEKKNKNIKTTFESDLLKQIAENERELKEIEFAKVKSEAEGASVIYKMRKETEAKANADYIRTQEFSKNKKSLVNKQIVMRYNKRILTAAAFAERSVKIDSQTSLPDPGTFKISNPTNYSVTIDDGMFKTTTTIMLTTNNKTDIYKKEKYVFGMYSFYKNNTPINELEYKTDVSKYIK
ncbi:MAG: hypothetical protein J0M08_11635 [Bacteroidetes bacterium]|nr:hypothetical protein [Bacteroidota bacterium]